jgi:hypothetical protein
LTQTLTIKIGQPQDLPATDLSGKKPVGNKHVGSELVGSKPVGHKIDFQSPRFLSFNIFSVTKPRDNVMLSHMMSHIERI